MTQNDSEEKTVTVRLKGKAIEQLGSLKDSRNAGTNSEVVRNALRTYNALEAYRDKDGSIVVEKPDGKKVRIILP